MRESEIEKILREETKKLGGRAYKWVSPGNAGVPDRIVVFPGRPPVFVELKAEKGTLTALQKAQIEKLKALGQDARVVKGLEGLAQFFEGLGHTQAAQRIRRKRGAKGGGADGV